jgi:alcohol dehydrogenase class IV
MDTSGRQETIFTYGAPALKYGWGAADEIGYDVQQLGGHRVLLVTDPGVAATGAPQRVADSVTGHGGEVVTYDRVHVEPTDASLRDAVAAARDAGPFDVVLAVGGGSSIDTAKAVALLTSCPGDVLEYVNAPVGGGRVPDGPVTPVVAVPTTTGTGSESTTICVLDVLDQHVKSGISHRRLRPVLAVVDPALTVPQPPEVTACSGMDVLCHALESWTARPFTAFPAKRPEQRVPYCGANPVSDLWAEKALRLLGGAFGRAVRDPEDREARSDMALAATIAGMGFGNAGVHVPHANAYPIAGLVRDYRPAGYPQDHAMVPHGMSVALTAAEAFRLTFPGAPERHLTAARLLAPDAGPADEPSSVLPGVVRQVMQDVGMPASLAEVGFSAADVPSLVEGAWKQQRLLATCPVDVTEEDLAGVFTRSLEPHPVG